MYAEALRLWKAGQADAALRQLATVTASLPLAAWPHYLRGLILLDTERAAGAMAAFRSCTYADPEYALGHLAQAGLLARIGRPGRARAALETAGRLVAGFEPDALLPNGHGVTAGESLELIAAQRTLLRPPGATGAARD
jgi:tetratricopeptide (TPR) repeat protein